MSKDPGDDVKPADLSAVSAAVQQSIDEDWAAFLEARRALAEVMTDDELSEFGFNLEELDRRP